MLPAVTGSARATAALAKRTLYLPASWPEEDDDTKAISLPLTVSWPLPAPLAAQAGANWRQPTTVLLLRVRGDLGRLSASAPILRRSLLGRDADRRGWHPAVVEVDQAWDGSQPLTLRGPVRLARLLLCLTTWAPKES